MNDETMTIREMCESFGVTPRTLRFYESKELLFPIREGQKRLYTARDRARLKLTLRGKRFGVALEDIRQILDLYDGQGGAEAQLRRSNEVAQQRLTEMVAQRAELDAAIAELRAQIAWGESALDTRRASSAA